MLVPRMTVGDFLNSEAGELVENIIILPPVTGYVPDIVIQNKDEITDDDLDYPIDGFCYDNLTAVITLAKDDHIEIDPDGDKFTKILRELKETESERDRMERELSEGEKATHWILSMNNFKFEDDRK